MKWQRRTGLAHQTIDGETLVVVPKERMYHALNEVGSHLWLELEKSRTTEELVESLCDVFEVEPESARADVEAYLTKLRELGLVEAR